MNPETIINVVLLGIPTAFTVFFAAMMIADEYRKGN